MTREISLASVAKEVVAWRKTKQHRTSILPTEIAAHIKELAKNHKRSHIAEALKMSGSTINKVLQINHFSSAPSVNKKQQLSLKSYSLEEKLALCEEWKRSSIGIEQFCKSKGISKSALYKWRRTLSPQSHDKTKNWVLVKPASEPSASNNEMLIELTLPNQSLARIKVLRMEAASFFQELYHAIAAIR